MKKQIIGIVLFVLSIISVFLSSFVIQLVGQDSFFDSMGTWRYSWIAFLFLPIPIATFIYGIILRKKVHVMIDIIIGIITSLLCLVIGCTTFVDRVDVSASFLLDAQNVTNISFPKNVKAMSSYEISGGRKGIAKILDSNEEKEFVNSMASDKWEDKCPMSARVVLPHTTLSQTEKTYEKYCLYLLPSGVFNPEKIEHGNYSVYYIAYDSSIHKLFVFDKYSIEI